MSDFAYEPCGFEMCADPALAIAMMQLHYFLQRLGANEAEEKAAKAVTRHLFALAKVVAQ